ncbi:MAG: 30S ribosomal protein S5 [Parcubacteria group bacterium GW2011_GWC1_43_11b]|nr:MAG: 30S ribosomal protein S5 [Parcubacteria group bacterium GW2011_GWC1_43_11b]
MEKTSQNKNNSSVPARPGSGRGASRPGGPYRGGPRRDGRGPRPERVKPEYDHKAIDIRRVARVVSGGRRFSFSVVLIAGNKKGKVGVGIGKAGDTSLAISKAMANAIKNMIIVPMTKTNSIAHEVEAKFGSSRVMIKPAPSHGLVAGSALRIVLELAGLHDINAKVLSKSKNKLNLSRATILALKKLSKTN